MALQKTLHNIRIFVRRFFPHIYVHQQKPVHTARLFSLLKGSFSDTKKILDYTCKKAVLTLKNGTDYTVYYVPWLVPSVNENPFEFKDVPGLVLEYESSANNEKVTSYPMRDYWMDIGKPEDYQRAQEDIKHIKL